MRYHHIAACAMAVAWAASPLAHGAPVAGGAYADLEKTFWRCDYSGTIDLVDIGSPGACSSNFTELLRTKFNGDFDGMLIWWQKNRVVQHQASETASGELKLISDRHQ